MKDFNKKILPGCIPRTPPYLSRVDLGPLDLNNEGVDSVTHLIFGDYFNQKIISGVIPKTPPYLSRVDLGPLDLNNEGVDSVTHITFDFYFNQEIIPGVIPISVTHLTFGKHFNKELNNYNIPKSVQMLIVNKKYNKDNIILDNIICIYNNNDLEIKKNQTVTQIKTTINIIKEIDEIVSTMIKNKDVIDEILYKPYLGKKYFEVMDELVAIQNELIN